MKDFKDLTKEELEILKLRIKNRAEESGRGSLQECFCAFRPIEELRELMTEEQKVNSHNNARKFYPEGTPEIMCTSKDDGEDYLKYVDPNDFRS